MKVSHIVAMSQNRVIGLNNGIPWHLPDDMKYFKTITAGHHVIMGRLNYESIPEKYRPLPNRTNVVVTRQQNYSAPGCIIFNDLNAAIKTCILNGDKEVFIIGGGEIYEQSLRFIDRIYLTEVKAHIDGNVYYPALNMDEWIETSRTTHGADEKHAYEFDFVVYDKKR